MTQQISDEWDAGDAAFAKGEYGLALRHYELLAEAGEVKIFPNIGQIYEVGGGGVERNLETSKMWYERAADAGVVRGYLCLARIYLFGKGVKKNYSKALDYYKTIEAYDDPTAAFALGWMYEKGLGVVTDKELARIYYLRATSRGHIVAGRYLARMEWENYRYFQAAKQWLKFAFSASRVVAKNNDDSVLRSF